MRRVLTTLILLGSALSLGIWPVVADTADRPAPPAEFVLDGDPEAGRTVFATQCALCHGEQADGQGTIFLDPPPRDLRQRSNLTSRDGWDVYRVIRDGGQALDLSPKMLPWGDVLSDTELHDVATFVWEISREAPSDSD